MDSLKRWREPASWLVLAALALDLVLLVPDLLVFEGPPSLMAPVLAYRVVSPTTIIVLAALVATCVLTDPTRHARLLTLLSMIATGVAVLLALVLALVGLTARSATSALDLATLLSALVVPVVGLGLLIKLWSLQSAGAEVAVPQPAPPPSLPDPAVVPPVDPQLSPTWQPDAAAGAVWRTAGEAAAGAPASGWGAPGPEGPDGPADPAAGRWSS